MQVIRERVGSARDEANYDATQDGSPGNAYRSGQNPDQEAGYHTERAAPQRWIIAQHRSPEAREEYTRQQTRRQLSNDIGK